MSKTTIDAWRCDKCHWVWVSNSKPDRCAKCKSRTWDGAISVGDKLQIGNSILQVKGKLSIWNEIDSIRRSK